MAAPAGRRRRGRPADPQARYRQVAADLRARLRAGDPPPGAPLPSLRQLASSLRAGEFTVRLAVELLKREGRLTASPRRRLVARPEAEARGALDGLILQVSSLRLDALHRGPYSDGLIRGVQSAAGRAGSPLLILHDRHFRGALPTDALDLPVRGVVLVGHFGDRTLRAYERLGVPVVMTDEPCSRAGMHSVTVDNFEAARDATARLLAAGHRRIAFVRYVQVDMKRVDPDARERQEGFFAALGQAGLPRSAGRVFNSLDGDTAASPAIRGVVLARPPFTAVLSASGFRAELVARAAESLGRSVPGDLSLACFQSTDADYGRFSGPRIDFEAMGRRAVELLAEPRHPSCHARIPAVWVDAGSVAPPRGSAG